MEGAKGMLLAVVGEEAVYTEDDYLYDYFFFILLLILWLPVKCSECPSHFDS